MVACRLTAAVVLLCVGPAVGAIFRHTNAGTVVGQAVKSNAEEVRRVAGLLDVERDLETDKKRDDTNLHELESQIVNLVHKRDAAKRDEGRKNSEIAFLQNQIGRARTEDRTEAVAQENHQESVKADLNVDAAIASADQVVSQAESAEVATQRSEEKVDAQASAQASAEADAQASARAAAEAAAEAAARRKAQEEAAASAAAAAAIRAEAEKKRKAAAEADESRAAFEARIRAEAEEKARMKIQAEQEAETRLRAEAEGKMRAKIEAEHKAEEARLEDGRAAERRKAEDEQKKKEELASHADDSFKDFMKEEDGEDDQSDPDYEDSANALAGAIGWNRKEIETKADSAVKQLTEAIGGRKVVQSLQGMMAGVR